MTDIPSLFAPQRLLPLEPRLSDDDAVSQARVVDPARLPDHNDPRLPPPDAMLMILRHAHCVLCAWPDQTLAWVGMTAGQAIVQELRVAYQQGRARLEQLHLLLNAGQGGPAS